MGRLVRHRRARAALDGQPGDAAAEDAGGRAGAGAGEGVGRPARSISTGYLTPYSDVVALMVLEHQAHATNLITRAGWEYRLSRDRGAWRASALSPRVREAVDDLVDYFLFVDEAPLRGADQGIVGVRREVLRARPARRQGPLTARAAAADAADEVSVQLHDLLAGLQGPAGRSQGRHLRAHRRSALPAATSARSTHI